MEAVRAFFYGPDPATQLRKCNTLIRQNARQLDRHSSQLAATEVKTKNAIAALVRRKNTRDINPELRILARELVRVRRQRSRMATAKAQLESVGMQVREAFAVRKIEGSVRVSAEVMKGVNSLVRVPEVMGTMRVLGEELVKAGIIEEMVGDMLPQTDEDIADEELEADVEGVIGEVLGKTKAKEEEVKLPDVGERVTEDEEDLERMKERLEVLRGEPREEDDEAMLGEMRRRLEELKS